MTPQVFCNILQHAYFKLDNCNLIIFDECHHASKNHPYKNIMINFYHNQKLLKKPRIFGMTASPVKVGVFSGVKDNFLKILSFFFV